MIRLIRNFTYTFFVVAPSPSLELPFAVRSGIETEMAVCCLCQCEPNTNVAIGRDFEYATSQDEWRMDRCDECGILILNPRPAEDEFERVYPPNYHAFQFDKNRFGVVHRVRRWLEAKRLLSIFRDLPADARILDVGCGDGFHLDLLKTYGPSTWELQGLDTSDRAVTHARKRGLNVIQGTVEESQFPENHFDAVLMIMTVEHLARPDETLLQIVEIMKPGGQLVIVTDNAASIDIRLFGKRVWGGYHFPRHTYLFNHSSLERLAEYCGLKTEQIRTIVSPVNWVYSIRNWLVSKQYPQWLVNQFSLTKPIPLAAFTILDNFLCLFGRGALLQAVFAKPVKEKSR